MIETLPRRTTRRRVDGLRVVFAGGGTGGHIAPGMALADRVLDEPGTGGVLFLSTDRPAERAMLDPGGYPRRVVASDPPGRSVRSLTRFAARQFRAISEAGEVLEQFGADMVVGLGGYGSLAGVVGAARRRIPIVLLEQNAVVGRANRLLCTLATEVHCQWPSAWEALAARTRVRLTGPTLRLSICRGFAPRAREALGLARRVRTVLIMGGSQGSGALNRIVREAIPVLERAGTPLQVIHIAGESEYLHMQRAYAERSLRSLCVPFLNEIEVAYQAADLVVGRAGATSIAEIATVGLPSLLIPFPHATDDHQSVNARCYARTGAAEVVPEQALSGEELAGRIVDLLGDRSRLESMSLAARHSFPSDGCDRSMRRFVALKRNRRRDRRRREAGGSN